MTRNIKNPKDRGKRKGRKGAYTLTLGLVVRVEALGQSELNSACEKINTMFKKPNADKHGHITNVWLYVEHTTATS